jgi:hypothetical protein
MDRAHDGPCNFRAVERPAAERQYAKSREHMGLDLTYEADKATFTHRFTQADWAAIEALRAHLPQEIDTCFDVVEFGAPIRIRRLALRDAASTIDRFLADSSHLLPATYQFKLERFQVPGVPVGGFSTGGMAGLRLPNDPDHFYSIHAGLNELVLRKMAVGADGKGVIVEERDMRNESELITESAGKIQFRRRVAKSTLRRVLREIAAFAEAVVSEEVTKTVG